MPIKIIVSYDGTDNDRDALALGKVLLDAGATLALAYVRHSQELEIGDLAVHGHEVYPSDIPSLGFPAGIPQSAGGAPAGAPAQPTIS